MRFSVVTMATSVPSGAWLFYGLGIAFVLLGISFFLIPLFISGAGNLRIPWILVYVYSKNGFYFATSPILIIISVIMIALFFIRR